MAFASKPTTWLLHKPDIGRNFVSSQKKRAFSNKKRVQIVYLVSNYHLWNHVKTITSHLVITFLTADLLFELLSVTHNKRPPLISRHSIPIQFLVIFIYLFIYFWYFHQKLLVRNKNVRELNILVWNEHKPLSSKVLTRTVREN